MTRSTSLVEEDRRRELFLEAALRDWRLNILQYARKALDQVDVGAVSPTSMQGLVSAGAAGPGRRGPKERLDSLKRYLAWRKLQADERDPWLALVCQVTADLTKFEGLAERLLEDVSDQCILPEEPQRAAVVRDLHLKMTDIYLHALASYYEDRRR